MELEVPAPTNITIGRLSICSGSPVESKELQILSCFA
jgi:hypothetical protein